MKGNTKMKDNTYKVICKFNNRPDWDSEESDDSTGKDGFTLLEAMRTVDFLHKNTHVTKITVIWVDSLGNRITLPNLY